MSNFFLIFWAQILFARRLPPLGNPRPLPSLHSVPFSPVACLTAKVPRLARSICQNFKFYPKLIKQFRSLFLTGSIFIMPVIYQKILDYENTRRKKEADKNIRRSERQFPRRPAHVATLASGFGRLFLTGSIFIIPVNLKKRRFHFSNHFLFCKNKHSRKCRNRNSARIFSTCQQVCTTCTKSL